jgi:hypothetical protein
VHERAAYWKLRAKCRELHEGDDNTAYFHARATNRWRASSIKVLEIDGQAVTSHNGKTHALAAHLCSILAEEVAPQWTFDADRMYANLPCANSTWLTLPFSEEEALSAIRHMNKNSAPSPDSFGSGFYQAAWHQIKDKVMLFLRDFHASMVDLDRINRAYVVLIPKGPDAMTTDTHRPICIQNCAPKIASKILTTRLQQQIQELWTVIRLALSKDDQFQIISSWLPSLYSVVINAGHLHSR